MSDQTGILPKWFSCWGIILAKGQLDHSNTLWTMATFIGYKIWPSPNNYETPSMKPYTTDVPITRRINWKQPLFYTYSWHHLDFIKNAPPWNSGEPNNRGINEDCVSMYKGRPVWNDIPCSGYRFYSICEFTPHWL